MINQTSIRVIHFSKKQLEFFGNSSIVTHNLKSNKCRSIIDAVAMDGYYKFIKTKSFSKISEVFINRGSI